MLVNFSNHPLKQWPEEQKQDAQKWGELVDIPFPSVPAKADEEEIIQLADKAVKEILGYSPDVVMCQGEFTLVYAVVCRLKEADIPVVAACSERVVKDYVEDGKQKKEQTYEFVRFREYK